jgi:hypothetical protein
MIVLIMDIVIRVNVIAKMVTLELIVYSILALRIVMDKENAIWVGAFVILVIREVIVLSKPVLMIVLDMGTYLISYIKYYLLFII